MKLPEPQWGPIGREVYERTYSRTMSNGQPETWEDTVTRVIAGNTALADPSKLWLTERHILGKLMSDFSVMPAGRHLWVSGVPGRQFLFNCHRAGWSTRLSDHFGFVFDELMKGGGIGSNYSDSYLNNVHMFGRVDEIKIIVGEDHPDFEEINPDAETAGPILRVEDSREGWVEAVVKLVDSHQYFDGPHTALTFDVSDVRPRGSLIHGFGGTASGPGPLAEMLRAVHKTLCGADTLGWQEAMLIDHDIARCVIAGNVRRSARMSIKLWSDPDILDFISLKADTGDHWTTNISVEFDELWFSAGQYSEHGKKVKEAVTAAALANGEPGLYNSFLAGKGESGDVRSTNPCGEIALEEWENCNLGHINLGQVAAEDLEVALRAMARFLIRATFSDIDNPLQQEVVARNRRIGVGLFGYQEWCIKEFNTKYSESWTNPAIAERLRWMYQVVKREAEEYSDRLGIPTPIKITTVAPTGTIAKLPGASEGIHPIYAKHFIRRVRYAENDPALETLGPNVSLEPDIYSDKTTVASFICADEIFLKVPESRHHLVESVEDISLSDMMAVQEMVQTNWADNAVSFTVNFPDGQYSAEEMEHAMFSRLDRLKGTTVMPDGTRPQAPYERLSEEEFERLGVEAEFGSAMDECATGACPIK